MRATRATRTAGRRLLLTPVLLVVASLLSALGVHVSAAPAAPANGVVPSGDGDRSISWLAAGDSFSSGEGDPQAVGDCAQSQRAFGPRAAKLLHTERGITTDPLAFTACTGAVATDFFNGANKSHPSQVDWADDLKPGGVFDVATMSFGGNDVDFAKVISRCVDWPPWEEILQSGKDGCDVGADELAKRVVGLEQGRGSASGSGPFGPNGTNTSLAGFFAAMAKRHVSTGGTLVVVGYPRLIAPSEQWPKWRNGMCGAMHAGDSDMVGDAAGQLDKMMRRAVEQARGSAAGRTISYVSRLELFDHDGESRSLCARGGTSWMNGLGAISAQRRIEAAFHPNHIGHLKTAERVAAVVERDLGLKQTPTATPTETATSTPTETPTETPTDGETISDGESGFEIGDSFAGDCSVAWPTAPSYTPTTIELTTTCSGVPTQFQFVHISYPDPDLPINPSTGSSHVEGVIVNVAVSEYGWKTLYVNADTYDLGSAG